MKCDINEYCNNFNNKDIEYYLMNSKFWKNILYQAYYAWEYYYIETRLFFILFVYYIVIYREIYLIPFYVT